MAYTVQGNTVRDGGGKLIDTGGDHRDAVKAAQDRAAPSSQTALAATAGRVVFFEFENAETFHSVVDVEAAMNLDVAGESDPAEVKALMARSPAEVTEAHRETVRAVQTDAAFTDDGKKFPAGSWVVMGDNGKSRSFLDADFRAAFVAADKPAKAKAKRGSTTNQQDG